MNLHSQIRFARVNIAVAVGVTAVTSDAVIMGAKGLFDGVTFICSLGAVLATGTNSLQAQIKPVVGGAFANIGPAVVAAVGVPVRNVVGCFVSNELLDAFPVHRFRVEGSALKELFVTLDEHDELTEALEDPCTPMLEQRIRHRSGRTSIGT